jgi:hypothetical protein
MRLVGTEAPATIVLSRLRRRLYVDPGPDARLQLRWLDSHTAHGGNTSLTFSVLASAANLQSSVGTP